MFCCFQLHDQNVPLILNAQSNLHAFKRSAKIPVLQPRVVSMPNAVPTITELCVFVKQACINRECVDPCPLERCGINGLCSAKNHRAVCSCPPGFRPDPDPYIRCKQYECLTDPECPTTLACQNEKCVDPCKCARNADCSPRNHRGICTCQPGFTGDPYGVACTPSKKFCHNPSPSYKINYKYSSLNIPTLFSSRTCH